MPATQRDCGSSIPALPSDSASTGPNRSNRPALVFGAGLLLVGVVASLPATTTSRVESAKKPAHLSAPVERGDLEVSLSQRGLLDSARNFVVSSQCEWTQRIIALVPEGTWVDEGDVVVELDASELTERLKEREVLLIESESKLVQAQEVLAMQKLENDSAFAKAKLTLELARLDHQKYADGEFPKAEKEAKAAVALAKEDVSRSNERYAYVARLVRKGYENPMALEKERLNRLKYENQLSNAEKELDLLVDYTKHRQLTELRAAVAEAERDLERVEKISKIAVINREVQVHSRKTNRDATLAYVERVRKSIEACTIRAPATGEIIYANEGSVRDEIIEGEQIRNRQDIVRVPDLSQMNVKVRIHESLINGIREGLPARIKIDAYPDREFTGHVVTVSRVPTSGSSFNSDLKEYDAAVRLDADKNELNGLKPGLTAQVKILVQRKKDCITVPVQSVVNVAGRNIVFVEAAGSIEPREIELGINNDVAIEVVGGLTQSERVLLSPRTTCSEELIVLEQRYGSETDVANIGG